MASSPWRESQLQGCLSNTNGNQIWRWCTEFSMQHWGACSSAEGQHLAFYRAALGWSGVSLVPRTWLRQSAARRHSLKPVSPLQMLVCSYLCNSQLSLVLEVLIWSPRCKIYSLNALSITQTRVYPHCYWSLSSGKTQMHSAVPNLMCSVYSGAFCSHGTLFPVTVSTVK